MKRSSSEERLRRGRRDFLRTSALAGIAAGLQTAGCDSSSGDNLPGLQPDAQGDTPNATGMRQGIGSRRTLGRTDLEIPDISFGTFSAQRR